MRALENWLDTVTRDLPAEVRETVRAELLAHFEDATLDYMALGLDETQAQAQALEHLGAARRVADGMQEVHRGTVRYRLAFVASLFAWINLLILPFVHSALGLQELSSASHILISVFDVVLVGLTCFALWTIRGMITWRFHRPEVGFYVKLIIVGLVLGIFGDIFHRILIGDALYPYQTVIDLEGEGLRAILPLLFAQIGRLIFVPGLVGLGYVIYHLEDNLYGLKNPLAIMGGLIALPYLPALIVSYLGATLIGELLYLLMAIVHLLIWPLFILLFFRLAYRSPVPSAA